MNRIDMLIAETRRKIIRDVQGIPLSDVEGLIPRSLAVKLLEEREKAEYKSNKEPKEAKKTNKNKIEAHYTYMSKLLRDIRGLTRDSAITERAIKTQYQLKALIGAVREEIEA